jgi:hypothetical protein
MSGWGLFAGVTILAVVAMLVVVLGGERLPLSDDT